MSISFTKLVSALPASTPFVGPETLERQHGITFSARIGANESAFGISPKAAEALHTAVENNGCSWYCDPENHELRAELADYHKVDMDEICVDAGIDSLLGLTVRMLVEPGMPVVTSDGAYPTFLYHVAGFGGAVHKVAYKNYHEDPQALLAKALETKARLIYFSNPDNPMGTSLGSETVQQMINEVPGHSLLLLDEAYIEFAIDNPSPAIDTSNPHVIRYRTFSKAYGMAGMRIGYVIGHRDLIAGFEKIRNHFGVNRLAQAVALASLRDNEFLPSVRQRVEAGRQLIYTMADEMNLEYLPSSTNFVAVDMGHGDNTRTILGKLVEQGIFIRMPGVAPLDRFLRVGVGSPEEHAAFEKAFRIIAPATLATN